MPKFASEFRFGLIAIAVFCSSQFQSNLSITRNVVQIDAQPLKTSPAPTPTSVPGQIQVTTEPDTKPPISPKQELDLSSDMPQLGPIFYNVYIPIDANQTTLDFVKGIIQEQMLQRNWSSSEIGGDTNPLFYTLIGYPNITNDFCQPNCFQRQYLPNGDEVNTLQALYEYCQNNTDAIVSYIHDKGSFHNTLHNTQTRRMATKATFDCRKEFVKNPLAAQYNVCTGKFLVQPQYLATANMWTAKCSYVRHLLPPIHYESAMRRMYKETIFHPEKRKTDYACLKPLSMKKNHLGLGRYAYERWVWSHPDVEPAVVLPQGEDFDFNKLPQEWNPRLVRAATLWPRWLDWGISLSSFARLEGRLIEWEHLYHKYPRNSSWIWRYYEDFESGSPEFQAKYCRS